MAGADPASLAVQHQAGNGGQIVAALDRVDHRRHHFFAVTDRDGIDHIVVEPARIARRVVAADDDERAGILALDALGQPHRAITLRREVALQSDHVRREFLHEPEAVLFAVDAQVEHLALVSLGFETRGDADRAERLDEREHLQAEDSADRRFYECDFHLVQGGKANGGNVISSSAP